MPRSILQINALFELYLLPRASLCSDLTSKILLYECIVSAGKCITCHSQERQTAAGNNIHVDYFCEQKGGELD